MTGGAGTTGGAGGTTGGDGSGIPDSGAPQPGILIFDGRATRVGVVSDREGNALVHWDAGEGQVHFARWIAAEENWLYPAPVVLDTAIVVDTHGSGHPILIGDEIDPDSGEPGTTVVRRFDVEANEWGPAQPTGIGGSFVHLWHLSMDGAGNVYAYWTNEDGLTDASSWWPVDSAAWQPTRTVNHTEGVAGARHEGAWFWQEDSGFGVRAFDLGARDWSDKDELWPSGSALIYPVFEVGPSGEALAAVLRHEPTELVMEVRRYDPELATWQPPETAFRAATDDDPNTIYGPVLAITDLAHHDIVAVPVPVGEEFELVMSRREPSTGIWSPLHTFVGLRDPGAIEFAADESGNLYGYAPPDTLFHYDAATDIWTETPSEGGNFEFAVSRRGAFALGLRSRELVAYRHSGADGEWRSARGMPEGVFPESGSVMFAIAPLGEDRALVVWPTRDSVGGGAVRAAFIE
jgi:hypothetical protein